MDNDYVTPKCSFAVFSRRLVSFREAYASMVQVIVSLVYFMLLSRLTGYSFPYLFIRSSTGPPLRSSEHISFLCTDSHVSNVTTSILCTVAKITDDLGSTWQFLVVDRQAHIEYPCLGSLDFLCVLAKISGERT